MRWILNHSGILALIWTVIIFLLCATPGEYIPSEDWMELLSVDKFVHASIFFILNTLLFLTWFKYKKSKVVFYVCFFGCVAYGVFLEYMQGAYFRNRGADWKDVIANTAGCLLALFLFEKIRMKFFSSLKTN